MRWSQCISVRSGPSPKIVCVLGIANPSSLSVISRKKYRFKTAAAVELAFVFGYAVEKVVAEAVARDVVR